MMEKTEQKLQMERLPAQQWRNGKRSLTGYYSYNWAANSFLVMLNSTDRITGRRRVFTVKGEKPEWGNWKLDTLKEKP